MKESIQKFAENNNCFVVRFDKWSDLRDSTSSASICKPLSQKPYHSSPACMRNVLKSFLGLQQDDTKAYSEMTTRIEYASEHMSTANSIYEEDLRDLLLNRSTRLAGSSPAKISVLFNGVKNPVARAKYFVRFLNQAARLPEKLGIVAAKTTGLGICSIIDELKRMPLDEDEINSQMS
eukprot:CAMPEP_0184072456 /NCGR_PEP_ID=MMETSP0957-20130417/59237_1 /TAXON_ID=627963 /ORGANISM="Aplanochytrium sp, Strain PBS07" /LENGTH=177 /DNA_ID=CAMNT_0026373517 /DNA_START=321 /DNA_END=850 /DNA_ORIENTATION=+